MELLAWNDRHRKRARQAFSATIETDAIRPPSVHQPPIEHAERGIPLVAIERQQLVAALDAAGGWSRGVDVRDKPAGVGRAETPTRILDDAVMPGDDVGREREEARVHPADEEYE